MDLDTWKIDTYLDYLSLKSVINGAFSKARNEEKKSRWLEDRRRRGGEGRGEHAWRDRQKLERKNFVAANVATVNKTRTPEGRGIMYVHRQETMCVSRNTSKDNKVLARG